MKICQRKNWSIDDFQALSEDAQLSEIAWLEYSQKERLDYLDILESKIHRNKDNIIDDPVSYFMILLAKLEVL